MLDRGFGIYWLMRSLLRTALGFYFSRIERFHAERVPTSGPVLFTSNHPNSLTDAFVIGASVPRKVNFVATVQLFRVAPLRWLLVQCGVVPINRVKDDPRAMRTVVQTFEACYQVLEKGEAVGIFPEGITHDDPQLKTVKSGAARMALELEHRHEGRLGLQIVPVGLTFSAKEAYRSQVLVNFGEALLARDYLPGYATNKHDCIQTLTAEIQRRIASLILHLPELERARIINAVKRLYLDRLRVGNRVIHEPVSSQAGDLLLTQAIAGAVEFIYRSDPARAARFANKLGLFEHWLERLNLREEELDPKFRRPGGRTLASTLAGLLLSPIALYGWVHRLLPITFVNRAIKHYAPGDKTHVSTTAIVSGIFAFGIFYGGCIALVAFLFGWPWTAWYALSLPVASLVAYYYSRQLRFFISNFRSAIILFRAPSAGRRLLALRQELIDEIEAARAQVPLEALQQQKTLA